MGVKAIRRDPMELIVTACVTLGLQINEKPLTRLPAFKLKDTESEIEEGNVTGEAWFGPGKKTKSIWEHQDKTKHETIKKCCVWRPPHFKIQHLSRFMTAH